MIKISFAGYRFPPEIIKQATWLYLRCSHGGIVTLTKTLEPICLIDKSNRGKFPGN